jgi:hypothetical protein
MTGKIFALKFELLLFLCLQEARKGQGDQIGRMFAQLVLVVFGLFFNYKSSQHFEATFPTVKVMH